ncbi:MAG: gliding motility-associated C-terminal domain-containing protein [Bacteroidetes bacterium]|nr:gliding motility-associated C-terminal domain-containing protein [Bacteroidota bacterium]
MLLRLILVFIISVTTKLVVAQVCSTLGQTPQTAFPVCGTDTFHQTKVPICNNGNLPTGCTDGALYSDKNPYWYRFTCFQAGTLGFQVKPNTASDDYDWQLFDITGITNLNDVYTNAALTVCNNWSSNPDTTGTSAGRSNTRSCAGPTYSNQTAMPVLIVGHTYLLMVSHFTDTQDGYSLYFKGGTAVITDPVAPAILKADAICDGTKMRVIVNKKMKCSSVASDGSDFSINTPLTSIIGATGFNCNNSFDMDSVILTLNNPLPPGNYTITAKIGTDGNTIIDNCGNGISVGDATTVTVYPVVVTPMDSITALTTCKPDTLQLVFSKPMQCSSIASNGSDFVITGPSTVSVIAAQSICTSDGLTTIIKVVVSPIFTGGIYQIKLIRGTDGNTIINECGLETPVYSTLNFTVRQAVDAHFNIAINYGCRNDDVQFTHNGNYGVNQWLWTIDGTITKTTQNTSIIYPYTNYGTKTVNLFVSNGQCTDTASVTYTLPLINLKAIIAGPDYSCPNDTSVFKDVSIGNILNWNWDFGNGQTSTLQNPPAQQYPMVTTIKEFPVRLVVTDAACSDTTYHLINIIPNCYIAVPSAFTPNGDGLNDYLYPLNAYKATNLDFRVFNRYGQIIFQTTNWLNKWDGTYKGIAQPSGTYVWFLIYTDKDTGKQISLKGTTVLIR